MTERTWMKKTCALCPFSRSKTLYLHPERAADFAYMAENPFNDFPCHKTAELYEAHNDWDESGYVHGENSFTCCGFLSLQVNENGNEPEGFEPDPDAFNDCHEMIDHHTMHWESKQQ